MSGRRRLKGEGSIRQRGPNLWEARVSVSRNGKRERLYATASTQDAALRKLQHLRNRARRDRELRDDRPDEQTVGDFLTYWLDTELGDRVDMGELEASTVVTYRRHVDRHLIPLLGDIALRELHVQQIRKAFRLMAKGRGAEYPPLGPGTRNVIHAALSGALQHAWRDLGVIDENPVRKMPLAKVSRKRPPLLPVGDAKKILAAVEARKHRRLRALWVAAMPVGLRPGEALGLCWDQVDFDEGVLTVSRNLVKVDGGWRMSDTKGHKVRHVPLPRFAVDQLREHRKAQMQERMDAGHWWRPASIVDKEGEDVGGQLVFTAYSRPGRPIHRDWLREELRRICESAGVPTMTPKGYLRHGGATIMLALGVDLMTIRDVLGHYSVDMTQVYAHVLDDSMRDVAVRLDATFGGQK